MSQLVEQIRSETLAARKARTDAVKTSLLILLLSEVQNVGKNDGGRDTTDTEAAAVVTKFVKNLNDVAKYGNAEQKAVAEHEISILTGFLPTQLTPEELTDIIRKCITEGGLAKLGEIMKFLKTLYPGRYDGAQAKVAFESLVTLNP